MPWLLTPLSLIHERIPRATPRLTRDLNKLLRQADLKNKCADLESNIQKIIPTFKITKKGQLTTKGKLAKGAKCSTLQGEQVDKLLTCVRAAAKEAGPDASSQGNKDGTRGGCTEMQRECAAARALLSAAAVELAAA